MKEILLVLVLLSSSNACLAEIYKWTDSSGKTHYSDTPPEGRPKQPKPQPSAFSSPVEAPSADNEKGGNTLSREERARVYQDLNLKSVPTNGVSQQDLYSLFNQITSACKSKQPSAYFALLSAPKRAMMLKMPAKDQQQAYSSYCDFAGKANIAIGGRPEGGIHSVEQDNYRTNNGVNISRWYIKTQQGQLVFRLKVIFENGQLRINDH
ncbi:MAG: DUF4124 domain-containing protein [Pseudomonadota bacterium]